MAGGLTSIMPAAFPAPTQMVGEGLKGGRLVAEVLSGEGYHVVPPPGRCSPFLDT